jgi:polyphenol oxidase
MTRFILPNWNVPKNIRAISTLRYPGNSKNHYSGLNLATHVGDSVSDVEKNRLDLRSLLPSEPKWLNQTHSAKAVLAEAAKVNEDADASYTKQKNMVCVAMTADCLPILITNRLGTKVAAIHAGWRGLASGIIESTLLALTSHPEFLIAWIGPSISKTHYEVGKDVYDVFRDTHTLLECQEAFKPYNNKFLADMPLLATQRLIKFGLVSNNIYSSNECTYAHSERYFSYRRDGITGRMATLIWIR